MDSVYYRIEELKLLRRNVHSLRRTTLLFSLFLTAINLPAITIAAIYNLSISLIILSIYLILLLLAYSINQSAYRKDRKILRRIRNNYSLLTGRVKYNKENYSPGHSRIFY